MGAGRLGVAPPLPLPRTFGPKILIGMGLAEERVWGEVRTGLALRAVLDASALRAVLDASRERQVRALRRSARLSR
jgi:hypothetical protein